MEQTPDEQNGSPQQFATQLQFTLIIAFLSINSKEYTKALITKSHVGYSELKYA